MTRSLAHQNADVSEFVLPHTYVRLLSPIQRVSSAGIVFDVKRIGHAEHAFRVTGEVQQPVMAARLHGRVRKRNHIFVTAARVTVLRERRNGGHRGRDVFDAARRR